jgi:hypothetical protein
VKPEYAETIGLQALSWLVSNEDLLPVFLGASGASGDDIKAGGTNPEFLGSVLDFLTMDDAWVTQFCDTIGLSYDAPLRARQCLPGGAQINWT